MRMRTRRSRVTVLRRLGCFRAAVRECAAGLAERLPPADSVAFDGDPGRLSDDSTAVPSSSGGGRGRGRGNGSGGVGSDTEALSSSSSSSSTATVGGRAGAPLMAQLKHVLAVQTDLGRLQGEVMRDLVRAVAWRS